MITTKDDKPIDFDPIEPPAPTLVSIVGAMSDRASALPGPMWHVWTPPDSICDGTMISTLKRGRSFNRQRIGSDMAPDDHEVVGSSEWMRCEDDVAEFIAASRSDVPALAHALILMRQQIEVMIRRMWGDWKSIEFGGAVLTVDEAVERELARIDREIQKAVWPETLKNETGGT